MIKRIVSLILLLSVLRCLWGCDSDNTGNDESIETTLPIEQTDSNPIEQTDSDYIVSTDWMTLYFSKKDYNESDIPCITAETVSVMADVRNYLGINYTLDEAEETVCCFDSTYRNEYAQKRSECFWDEKKMYCISLDDFVHEYVHMISENNTDLAYHPDTLFIEGLAQYVSLNFYDGIASQQYVYFKEEAIAESSDVSEHQTICNLLSEKGLTYNAENYNKAFVAILDKNYDVSVIDKNNDFYKYYIGHVFVDYCINQLGGIERFLVVYCDSVTIVDIYGKTVDELIAESCSFNTSEFFGK